MKKNLFSSEELKAHITGRKETFKEIREIFQFMELLPIAERFSFLTWIREADNVSKDVKKKIAGEISNPTSPLLEIENKDLELWLKLLIAEDPEADAKKISDVVGRQIKDWDKVIAALATHQGKLVNPKSNACVYKHQTKLCKKAYISSRSLSFRKSTSYSGNATYLGKRSLLETEFVFQGKVTSVTEAVLAGDEAVKNSLKRIGILPEHLSALEDMVRAKMSENVEHVKDDLPQVLFPVDGSYISITSLPSVGVLNAIRKRRSGFFTEQMAIAKPKEVAEDKEANPIDQRLSRPWIAYEFTAVGGAQPQNSGSYNMKCGGRQWHLVSEIPGFDLSAPDRLFRRLRYRKTLFYAYRGDSPILDQKFIHSLNELDNRRRRRFLNKFAQIIVDDVMVDAETIRRYLRSGEALPDDFKDYSGLSAEEQKVIVSWQVGSSIHLTKEEKASLINQATNSILPEKMATEVMLAITPYIRSHVAQHLGYGEVL